MSDLNLLLQSRVEFFRRYRSNPNTTAFMQNESRLISLVAAERQAALIRSISISVAPSIQNFFDPVPVIATSAQIATAFEVPAEHPEGECSICQDSFQNTRPTITLRGCRHHFHRDCAESWYNMSVYCPLCRHDIRTPAS